MKEKYFKRFSLNQRIQHLILLLSFITLAITGLPLKFHDVSFSQSWMALWGGVEVTRLVHRFAAIAFTGVFVYHLAYLVVKALTMKIRINRRPEISKIFPIFPVLQDIKDFFRLSAHYLGFIKRPPRFGRYDMFQKFEYWAGAWGLVIMIVTGLVNWFPTTATGFIPGWVIPFAKMVHGWEAVLAVLSLVLIHIYATIWSPRVFPLDPSIWTGKISAERLLDEHPLEYEQSTETKKD